MMPEVENPPGLGTMVTNRDRRCGLKQCRSTEEGEQKNQGGGLLSSFVHP